MTLVCNSFDSIRVLVRASFDPTGLLVSAAVLGPDGAGILEAEWVPSIWWRPWVDGAAMAELFYAPGWRPWSELWVRVDLCEPVPVGRLAAITRTGDGGG